jgi:hypothetical protein
MTSEPIGPPAETMDPVGLVALGQMGYWSAYEVVSGNPPNGRAASLVA